MEDRLSAPVRPCARPTSSSRPSTAVTTPADPKAVSAPRSPRLPYWLHDMTKKMRAQCFGRSIQSTVPMASSSASSMPAVSRSSRTETSSWVRWGARTSPLCWATQRVRVSAVPVVTVKGDGTEQVSASSSLLLTSRHLLTTHAPRASQRPLSAPTGTSKPRKL